MTMPLQVRTATVTQQEPTETAAAAAHIAPAASTAFKGARTPVPQLPHHLTTLYHTRFTLQQAYWLQIPQLPRITLTHTGTFTQQQKKIVNQPTHISRLTILKWQICCKACLPETFPWPTPCGLPTYLQYSVATSVANQPTGAPATALLAHRPSGTKEHTARSVDNRLTRSARYTLTPNTT